MARPIASRKFPWQPCCARGRSEPRGFIKMLIEEASDRILGFSAFGAEVSELMATVQNGDARPDRLTAGLARHTNAS
jgi:pyruvate/2-oxoglutarate dehydrogenase complex dihydrolipoamide dehydrogenase (E3) component